MNPELVSAGMALGALALIAGAAMSAFNGSASVTGEQFRELIRPILQSIRERSTLSRSELADRSMLAAIAGCALAVLVERSLLAGLAAVGLQMARPMVIKLVSQEHPLLALGDSVSANFIIGLYVPVVLAHVLLGELLTGGALMLVVVALSWPAGGGARRLGPWRPAWQTQ